MIEFDIDPKIERELLKLLKGRTKKFLKYLEDNKVDIEDHKEIEKAIKEFEEQENKKIFGINKVLLFYTLSSIFKKIDKKQQEQFKNIVDPKLFLKTILEADKKTKELYIRTSERTAYHLEKYIKNLRETKEKSSMAKFEEKIEKDIIKDKWEEAKQIVEEKMSYSDLMNSNNILGETQAEYIKIIMKELGIKSFVWITKNDNRVREKHSWRNGKMFDMNGKLIEGKGEDSTNILPKQEWGCRCKMGIDEKKIKEVLENVS